jgi:transcriptional regulator with XRE-family HTH domain
MQPTKHSSIPSNRLSDFEGSPWYRAAIDPRPSTRAFGEALRGLMDARGLSYRDLASATRELDGRGMTHAHINMLANGHDRPSVRAMDLIARACGVEPDYFAEYRLAIAMRELDPAEVGLEQALENLNARLEARQTRGAGGRRARRPQAPPHPSA